jgi:hypothetical protein
MRAPSTTIVVLIGTVFLFVGCSQTTSPTSLTSAPANTASITSSSHALQASAPKPVPFKGEFQGGDTVTDTIATNATGNGTVFGRLSLNDVLTFTSSGGTGSGHWIAANQDSIETTFVIESATPSGDVLDITENHTITAGAGRFSDAQGSFKVHRTHRFVPSDDGTHVTSGTFEGTITSAGAAH